MEDKAARHNACDAAAAPAPTETPETLITPDEVVELTDWWNSSDTDTHVECCAKQVFLCGAPFHEEAAASDPARNDACEGCLDEIVAARCPPLRPTHFHCQATGLELICQGPKRKKDR